MKTKQEIITLKSNGRTGQDWITWFENNKYNVGDYAKGLLLSSDFKPTKNKTYQAVIIKGKELAGNARTTKDIRNKATSRGYITPPAEVACLLRAKLSDGQLEAMGLWYIVTMHEPIKDSDGDPRLLSADRGGVGRWLYADYGRPVDLWIARGGFAFVFPPSSPKNSNSKPSFDPLDLELRIEALEQQMSNLRDALLKGIKP